MKNVVIAALLLIGTCGIAQEKEKSKPKRDRVEMTAQQRNDLKLKELTLQLDLTASQQKEMATIISEQETKKAAAREQIKAKRSNQTKPTSDEVYAMRSKMLDEQIAHKATMKKLLTKEQFEKWEKSNQRKKEHFGKGIRRNDELKPEPPHTQK